MTIMRRIGRLILRKSPSYPPPQRWMSTTAATQPRKRNLLFDELAKTSTDSNIPDILNKLVAQGKNVTKRDIVNLGNYFRTRKNFHAALQLYHWMESRKLEINTADQAICIDLLCKTEGIASAEKYFHSLQVSEKTNRTYGALLSCYCRKKIHDKALDVFEKIKVLNYTSTLNYNNMLSLYYSMEQPEKVVSLVQEMEEKNIATDLYTYKLLINSYAALKNLEAIEGVLEKMKSRNKEFDLFTYSCLHDKANTSPATMEKIKMQPDEGVYEACHTRIKLYSDMNISSGVNRAWETLKSAFPNPSNTSYLFMLLALSKLGDQENLEKLFKEWEEGCSSYDCRLPNVLLEYYLSHNLIEEATSLYKNLANRGAEPNLRTMNLFATLCIKNSEIDLAVKYLEMGLDKAKQRNVKLFPADETIRLFVNYFEENSDTDRAEKFIQCMRKYNRLDSNSLLLNIKTPDAGT